jgi:hypothetical protein
MKQGPKRDRERIEAKSNELFKGALREWDEEPAAGGGSSGQR